MKNKKKEKPKHKPVSILNLGQLTKRDVYKLNMDGPISECISRENLIAQALPILEAGGIGFFYKKNGQVIAIFLFRMEQINEALNENKETYGFVLDGEYIIEEYMGDYESMKTDIINETKDYVLEQKVSSVRWKDETYIPEQEKINLSGMTIPASLLWFLIGLMLGYNAGGFFMGICFGICFALCFGTSMKLIQNSNSMKKENATNIEDSEINSDQNVSNTDKEE